MKPKLISVALLAAVLATSAHANGIYEAVQCPPPAVMANAERLGASLPCDVLSTYTDLEACKEYLSLIHNPPQSHCYERLPNLRRVD